MSATIPVRVAPSLEAWLRLKAKQEERSLSYVVRKILLAAATKDVARKILLAAATKDGARPEQSA